MLRMLLAGALLAIGVAAPACAKPPAAEARVAAAGKVTTVTGHVTVTPAGGAARDVQTGDVLASDDTITTGAGAQVDVVLDKNHALLHLDGGQTVRLEASLAWSLPPQTGSAVGPSSDGLASAGRPAENAVAQTTPSSTTVATAAPPIAAAAPAPEVSDRRPAAPPMSQPLPLPKPTPPIAHAVTPPPPRLPPRTLPAMGDVGGNVDRPGGPPPAPTKVAEPVLPDPTLVSPSEAQRATIRGCFAKTVPNDEIILHVDASHRVTDARYNAVLISDTNRACLTTALAPLALGEGRYILFL